MSSPFQDPSHPEPTPEGPSTPGTASIATATETLPQEQASIRADIATDMAPLDVKQTSERTYKVAIRTLYTYTEKKRHAAEGADSDEVVGVTLTEVVEDFLGRDDLSESTYKGYRAAVLWHARKQTIDGATPGVREEARGLVPRLEAARLQTGRPKEDTGPSWIPEADYHDLNNELMRRGHAGSRWADRAHAWLMAGTASGLRPGEWLEAKWDTEDLTCLVVVTGKAKLFEPAYIRKKLSSELARLPVQRQLEDRTRRVPIERRFEREIVDTHLQYIDEFLRSWRIEKGKRQAGRPPSKPAALAPQQLPLPPRDSLSPEEMEQAFKAYYLSVRDVIRHACLRLWAGEKLYSLYSARHQFSANKRAEVGPAETAAQMGHSSADSNSAASYASRHGAHARSKAAGAERLRSQGPEMDEQLRQQLAERRRHGGEGEGDTFDDADRVGN